MHDSDKQVKLFYVIFATIYICCRNHIYMCVCV